MLEKLEGFPANVIGIAARGRVTRDDYDNTLIPAMQDALKQHDKLRVYYEFDPSFAGMDAGAMWEDFTFGMGHWARWDKVAVVTDTPWITHAVNAFRFMMPCPAKVFPRAEAAAARSWVVQ